MAGDVVRGYYRCGGDNHRSALSAQEMASRGFVTVRHDPEVLRRLSQVAPGIVAVVEDRVVGCALDFAGLLYPDRDA